MTKPVDLNRPPFVPLERKIIEVVAIIADESRNSRADGITDATDPAPECAGRDIIGSAVVAQKFALAACGADHVLQKSTMHRYRFRGN
jgi:hypothetical protein